VPVRTYPEPEVVDIDSILTTAEVEALIKTLAVLLTTEQTILGIKKFQASISAEGGLAALAGKGLIDCLELDVETELILAGMLQIVPFLPLELKANPNDYFPLGALPAQSGCSTVLGSKVIKGVQEAVMKYEVLAGGGALFAWDNTGLVFPEGTKVKAVLSETEIEVTNEAKKTAENVILTFFPVSVYILKANKAITFTSWRPHPNPAHRPGQILIVQNFSAFNFTFVHEAKTVTSKGKLVIASLEVKGLTEAEKKPIIAGERVTGVGIPVNTFVKAVLSEEAIELTQKPTKEEEVLLTFAAGSPESRFKFGEGLSVTVKPGAELALRYDNAGQRWRGSYLSSI
jgi:hypothetical protein